jgi:hypothetical protein
MGNLRMTTKDDDRLWNRCDVCGQFIAMHWFDCGKAKRELVYPDSEFTQETWDTLCPKHADD